MVLAGIGYHRGRFHGRRHLGPRHRVRPIPYSYVPGPETVYVEADRVEPEDDDAIPERPEAHDITGLGELGALTGGDTESRVLWFAIGAAAVTFTPLGPWLKRLVGRK